MKTKSNKLEKDLIPVPYKLLGTKSFGHVKQLSCPGKAYNSARVS
jgi:hypothetical protein